MGEDESPELAAVYLRNELQLNFGVRLDLARPLDSLRALLDTALALRLRATDAERQIADLTSQLTRAGRDTAEAKTATDRARTETEAMRAKLRAEQEANRRELCRLRLERDRLEAALQQSTRASDTLRLLAQRNDPRSSLIITRPVSHAATSAVFPTALSPVDELRGAVTALCGLVESLRIHATEHLNRRGDFLRSRLSAALAAEAVRALEVARAGSGRPVRVDALQAIAGEFRAFFSFCESFDRFLSEEYRQFVGEGSSPEAGRQLTAAVEKADLGAWLVQHQTALENAKEFLRCEVGKERARGEKKDAKVIERVHGRLRSLDKFLDEFRPKKLTAVSNE